MPREGRYLYGLARTDKDLDFGAIGLEFAGAPGRVHTVRVDSVAAVVSPFAGTDKVMPLRKNLEPHHRVIREVMKTVTIAPLAFGHVAKSEDAVLSTLRRNRDNIRDGLDRVDGMVELSLKVKWDVDNIFEYFVGLDSDLAAYRDEIFGRAYAPGQPEKLELGRMFEQRLTHEREVDTDRVVEAFGPACSDVKVNPPKNEKSVMDLAFLVPRDGVAAFEECLSEVASGFPAQYTFDFGGPWAPFNFVEIDLRQVE
ncbi:MAG: GvpL/GvpF family gas vesicle protein [Deltaproteobacteria bacterium]|nr:GvpL/GvpF family gas vesicle protein [Deltaproteobacteria bacterium]